MSEALVPGGSHLLSWKCTLWAGPWPEPRAGGRVGIWAEGRYLLECSWTTSNMLTWRVALSGWGLGSLYIRNSAAVTVSPAGIWLRSKRNSFQCGSWYLWVWSRSTGRQRGGGSSPEARMACAQSRTPGSLGGARPCSTHRLVVCPGSAPGPKRWEDSASAQQPPDPQMNHSASSQSLGQGQGGHWSQGRTSPQFQENPVDRDMIG